MLGEEQNTRLQSLMKRSQEGDSEAYEVLLTELWEIVTAYLRRRMGDSAVVEEMAQEILLTIHSVRHTYLPDRPFAPWMFAIVRHRFIDQVRSLNRISRREVLNLDSLEEPAADEVLSSETKDELEDALTLLSARQRQALQLLKLDGLSTKEAARSMKLSEGALRVLAHRAYEVLRRAYRGRSL